MARPRDHVKVFAGAGSLDINQVAKFVRVLEAPTDAVYLALDDNSEVKVAAGQGLHDPDGFKRVTVRSAVAQTVRLRVSETLQPDNATNVAVTATATVEGATVVTAVPYVEVPAGTTVQLVAGNPDRIEVRLALASTAPGPIWFAEAGVGDEEGGLLEPGMVDYPATTAALFAHNPHATDSVWVSVLDLTKP